MSEIDIQTALADLKAKTASLLALKKSGVKTLEPNEAVVDSAEMLRLEETKKSFRMYCASIEVERTRMARENCVRLGDSTFYEKSFVDEIDSALQTIYNKYQALC